MNGNKMTKWRPANGTEGDYFRERFCERCEKRDECEIQDATIFFDIDEPGYPAEWIKDGPTGKCTAFIRRTDYGS